LIAFSAVVFFVERLQLDLERKFIYRKQRPCHKGVLTQADLNGDCSNCLGCLARLTTFTGGQNMHRLRLAIAALIMVVFSTAVSASFASAQESNPPLVVSSDSWQDAFNAGESGAFVNPDTMSGPSTNLDNTTDGPPEGSVYLVGILTGHHLARCNGDIVAQLDPDRFEGLFGYLVPNYPYVGLLAMPQADGTYYKVLDVRAIARSGYCGRTPPRQPVETGELGIGEAGSPIPFRLWGCFRPMGRRTIPLHVWPQTELLTLFQDHLDWETTLQGKVSQLKVNLRNGYGEFGRETMHELERAIFVDELGCGKRHTAFLPAVYCDWRCQKLHFPAVLNGQDPKKSWPSGRSSVYLPIVSTWRSDGVAATPFITTSVRVLTGETDSDAAPNGLAQRTYWLCSLRSTVLVTDDGGHPDTITDTKKLKLLEPVSMGDRVSQLTPTEHFRLTWPWVSPGRVDGKACEGVIVSNSNQRHAVLIITRDGYYEFSIGGDFRVLPNGAVLFGHQVGNIVTFYIALEGAIAWPSLFDEGVFGFAKFEMDVSDPALATVRQIGFFQTWSPVYEVAETSIGGRMLLQLVEEDGLVRSVDPSNMQEVATTRFPNVQRTAALEPRFALHRGVWHHRTNSIEEGGRYMVIGSGKKSGVVVVDLVDHTSWILETPEAQKILGVAIKHTSGGTRGLLAVHGGDRVFVLQPNSDWKSARLLSQFIFPKSSIQPLSYLSGPQGSIGWLWGDEFVVSWGQEDPRTGRNHRYEFARIKLHVDNNVMTLDWVYDVDWNWKEAWPNDIWQCEGECAGPPPPTSTPVPTNTPIPTATPTTQPTVTPSPTVGPCVPSSKPADIMLVADGSTSMEGDRSKQLGLAVEVFTSMVAQPNRIGLVTFAGGAALRQPLTNDRDAVGRALRGTILSAGTRIDLGLQKAREELNGANHRQEFAKVIVLITDGEHNGTPEDTVLEQAALAKKEGAIIFTIALGTTQRGQDLLKLVATSPDRHFFFSPSPTQLVAIYQEIARAIPCPTSTPTP